MINPNLIEQQWCTYYDALKLGRTSVTQQREMKRAFSQARVACSTR